MPGWWRREGRLVVPFGLVVALLATVVAAGVAPNAGLGVAAANCTYGQCPTSPAAFPVWAVTTALALVVVALLLALLLLRRRRRPGPPAEPASPPEAAEYSQPPDGADEPTEPN